MPAVSVILPTHRRPQLLPRAVRSVLEQSFADLELIVVDDGSRSAARELSIELADPRLRVESTPAAVGPSRARNLGLDAARAPWIAFQDDDDEWLPGKLERQMEVVARCDDRTGAVYGGFDIRFADGRRVPGGREASRLRGELYEELLRGNFIGLPTVMIRRSCLETAGTFDVALPCLEDWELLLRVARRYRFEKLDATIVVSHDSPGSVNKAGGDALAKAYERILEAHREAIETRPAIHAEFLRRIGHHLMLGAHPDRGRSFLRQAMRHRGSTWRATAAWTASWLGPSVYRGLARGLRARKR